MFLNLDVLQGGVVSTSPNPQAGGINISQFSEIASAFCPDFAKV